MYIAPLSSISPAELIQKQAPANEVEGVGASFKDMLSGLIENVNEADRVAKNDILKIASGNADDLHTIMINAEKAEIATLMAVQVRNKILDAYNEIMRITL
ncbi:MAG: flagellar hook-basal body complex protein FliE [Oscillospiraceae bacterium]|nr:flagellar hook-basal body complex protein FliE [Oscillospiraceae bacterium]